MPNLDQEPGAFRFQEFAQNREFLLHQFERLPSRRVHRALLSEDLCRFHLTLRAAVRQALGVPLAGPLGRMRVASHAKTDPFEVTLPSGGAGAVLGVFSGQVKRMGWQARRAVSGSKASPEVVTAFEFSSGCESQEPSAAASGGAPSTSGTERAMGKG